MSLLSPDANASRADDTRVVAATLGDGVDEVEKAEAWFDRSANAKARERLRDPVMVVLFCF